MVQWGFQKFVFKGICPSAQRLNPQHNLCSHISDLCKPFKWSTKNHTDTPVLYKSVKTLQWLESFQISYSLLMSVMDQLVQESSKKRLSTLSFQESAKKANHQIFLANNLETLDIIK